MIEELFDENFQSLIRCFKLNDKDGSGTLNFAEFKSVVGDCEGFEDYMAAWCSGQLGRDCINLKEFLDIVMITAPQECMWENVEREIEKTFADIDIDGDGFIVEEELKLRLHNLDLLLTPDEQMKLFKDADKNCDGKISFQEFKEKMYSFIGMDCTEST